MFIVSFQEYTEDAELMPASPMIVLVLTYAGAVAFIHFGDPGRAVEEVSCKLNGSVVVCWLSSEVMVVLAIEGLSIACV